MINIHIIGAGSIGLLFAHRLSKCGHSIQIITRSEKQSEELNRHGVVNQSAQKITAGPLEHTQFHQADAVLIAVKQYHLEAIMPAISDIPASIPLIFLQNGMSHLEHLSSLTHEHIFVSTVEHGAKKLNAYSVQHNGVGWWRLAAYRGEDEKLQSILACHHKDFPIEYESDYLKLLRVKLIKNLMINPLTAIFQVKNGVLADNPYFNKMMISLYEELSAVFPEEIGYCSFQDILDLCRRTAENESSMLSDIKAGRKTEVESLTGYAIKIAEEKNVMPVLLIFLEKSILAIQIERGSD
ncbi:2-dehydropantoate 2-reductase [Jeotgalibacillus malaysiensis]|uniref:2-dehydropantoate 2-reductase n=1 Tax=Jeotgalibacillus malaysiensis TaxID=1508404 RepID=A0A0B5AQH4_9BACL|nr:2-dehydropantoate 2-reductase [Jeotgalibacillus malaysiensis]AJD90902.1 2-dehydropantoate 2-reductase [Jeotgalibacillus malaysiensis]